MDMIDAWIVLAFFSVFMFIAHLNINAAYRNGVCDGYGFSKEPNNPGYKKAGEYLKKVMSHRWPEIED